MAYDPRLDPTLKRPPVRIGATLSRQMGRQMLRGSQPVDEATGFGMRETRNAPVPIRLRIDKGATAPNSAAARASVIPMGIAHRKRPIPGRANA